MARSDRCMARRTWRTLQAYRARGIASIAAAYSASARSRGIPRRSRGRADCLPFAEPSSAPPQESRRRSGRDCRCNRDRARVAEPTPPEPVPTAFNDEEFSFTIAIGRYIAPPSERATDAWRSMSRYRRIGNRRRAAKSRNRQRQALRTLSCRLARRSPHRGDHRRVCLLFAYGGFMALFSSLGGQFSATKLNAAVYVATFAVVYLQYFALFTIFGGTTPGMMFRGLQVASFSGAPPTPRQYLLRSLGYVLSARRASRDSRGRGGTKTTLRGTIAFRART